TLASGSRDGTVRIWDAETGRERLRLEGHMGAVFSVSWSLDSRSLASGSYDQTVRIWDAETGRERHRLDGHPNPVWSVSWSPDGRSLASGSSDGTVRIWDVADLAPPRLLTDSDQVAAYVARQAATVGRAPAFSTAPLWVPQLAEAAGDCLG